jgi:uncharacterized protein (DUF1778 family)
MEGVGGGVWAVVYGRLSSPEGTGSTRGETNNERGKPMVNIDEWARAPVWPDPMSVELRTQRLHIRVTPTEHRTIASAAGAQNITVAQFVRELIVREAEAVNATISLPLVDDRLQRAITETIAQSLRAATCDDAAYDESEAPLRSRPWRPRRARLYE